MTMYEILNEAIDVQSACNGSGVAHSLARVFVALRECGVDNAGDRNSHDAVKLFVAKLADLAGLDYAYPMDAEKRIQDKIEKLGG